MAQRRMFSPQIVDSDAFLDMSPSAQNLYFHLGMRADDDGFVGNPKKILRVVGGNDDDLKILLAKRFLLSFESGVVVIKHWLIHNLIRADLYKETTYKNEKSKLGLNENGAYTEIREGVSELKKIEPPEWLKIRRKDLRTANVPQTALRLGKVRVGKEREEGGITPTFPLKEKFSEEDKTAAADLAVYYNLKINPKAKLLDKAKDKIKARLKNFSVEDIKRAMDNFSCDDWKMKNVADKGIAWFCHSDERIEQYINLKSKIKIPNTNASISSEILL